MRKLFTIIAVLALLSIIGLAGASDTGNISTGQLLIRAAVSVLIFAVSATVAQKKESAPPTKAKCTRNMRYPNSTGYRRKSQGGNYDYGTKEISRG